MLGAAGDAWGAGDFNRANVLLNSIERVLDKDGHFIDPFAANYWNIVQSAMEKDYEVHQVTLTGDEARVLASEVGSITLVQLNMVVKGQAWTLSN